MMEEREVRVYVEKFFAKHNYMVSEEKHVHGYKVDVLAEKNDKKYFVECKGDTYLRSHEIHVMVGQIVSEMHEIGSNIHYGLAIPFSLATYLREFSVAGIKALNLHLFVIGQGDLWKGEVFHLDAESTMSFIQALRKDPKEAWFDLFSLRKKSISERNARQ